MPRPFRPHSFNVGEHGAVTVMFHMPDGRDYAHPFTPQEVDLAGGPAVIARWADLIDSEIRAGPRARATRMNFSFDATLSSSPPSVERETEEECSERIAAQTNDTRPDRAPALAPLEYAWQQDLSARITASETALRERMARDLITHTSAYTTWRPLSHRQTFITDEVIMPTQPGIPNEGLPVMPEPTHYLGMPVARTANVARNAVVIQNAVSGRRTIYVNPNTEPRVWQAEVRRQIARLIQRSAPVSIKQNCRYCGKAYPARQGLTTPDPYCSDRCREAARDLIDCPVCHGTGRASVEGAKCGECFGSTYKPCDACQEDHARVSLVFTNPSSGTVYYVCPACVHDEREAGGVQAPHASV